MTDLRTPGVRIDPEKTLGQKAVMAAIAIPETLERLITAVNELRSVVASVGEQIANNQEGSS